MRSLILCSLTLAWVSSAQPAPLPFARVEAGRVFLDFAGAPGVAPVEVGCAALSAVIDRQLHVACNDGRVRTFELTQPLTLINELRVDGELRGVFLRGQQAWVEVARYDAKPVRQATLAPAGASSALLPPLAVAPLPALPISPPPQQPTATTYNPPPPAPVKTASSEDSIFAPPRQGGVVIFEAGLHAMVPIGTLGIGAVVDLALTWHAEIPFALRARLSPLGGVTASSTSPLTGGSAGGVAAGSIDAIFDSRFFAAGLGLGFGTYKNFTFTNTGSRSTDAAGFLVSQHLRIGTIDGLNLTAQTQLVATEESGFTIYGGEALLQIPVRRDWQLRFRGGGSRGPFAFGELGMRMAVGSEGRPRLFLTPSVGVIYLTFAGPSVGLALDYQL